MINSCNKQGCLGCSNSKSPDESYKAVFLNHFKQVPANKYDASKTCLPPLSPILQRSFSICRVVLIQTVIITLK